MNTIAILKKELKTVIKESLREVLAQELMRSRALFLSMVSRGEQKDIEKRYGKPLRRAEKTIEIEL